jgi:hypothetical protein
VIDATGLKVHDACDLQPIAEHGRMAWQKVSGYNPARLDRGGCRALGAGDR